MKKNKTSAERMSSVRVRLSAKSKAILSVSVIALIVGTVLFMCALPSVGGNIASRNEEPDGSFVSVLMDVEGCTVNIRRSSGETFAVFSGFDTSAYVFGVRDGILIISDKISAFDFFDRHTPSVRVSGLGTYLAGMIDSGEDGKIIDVYFSDDDLSKPLLISSDDSVINIHASVEYVTMSAKNSYINAPELSFVDFNAELRDCDISVSVTYDADSFSRNISVYDCVLNVNGSTDANSDIYSAGDGAPEITLTVFNGNVFFSYDSSLEDDISDISAGIKLR